MRLFLCYFSLKIVISRMTGSNVSDLDLECIRSFKVIKS